jgi:lipoate-protein ligase B
MSLPTDQRYGWVLQLGRVDYERALSWQRGLVKMRREGMARDTIILVEHPPVVTVGRDGHVENFDKTKFTPIKVERGGDVTYHGPGQQVAYFIFNLTRRGRDLHRFMDDIQRGVIATLKAWGLSGRKDDQYTGVWVDQKKIASVGIAVKNWITYHGVAINVNTDLADFAQINPCGLQAEVMTSVKDLTGNNVPLSEFSKVLIDEYSRVFETMFTPVRLEELAEDVESQAGGYTI